MQLWQMLHAMLLAFAALLAQPGVAGAQAQLKQIRLTEKQVQGFISAQKDRLRSPRRCRLIVTNQIQRSKPTSRPRSRSRGFKDFDEYDDVALNISLIMTGIDPQTRKYTEQRVVLHYYDKIEAALQ
jgi:hypothetical protein